MFIIGYYNGRGEKIFFVGSNNFSYLEKEAKKFKSYEEASEEARRLNKEFDLDIFINLIFKEVSK